MVPTSSIKEIKELFAQALTKVDGLVRDIDQSESEIRHASTSLFIEAARVVIPTLKYVDGEEKVGDMSFRGVWIDEDLLLTRRGEIVHKSGDGKPIGLGDFTFWIFEVDDHVEAMIARLTRLAEVFSEALKKMDSRRENLSGLKERLTAAASAVRED